MAQAHLGAVGDLPPHQQLGLQQSESNEYLVSQGIEKFGLYYTTVC